MSTFLLGALALAVGLLLCLRGAVVLRILIALWATLVGFVIGAASVAAVTGDSFLAGALAFTVAVVTGLVFGAVAYVLSSAPTPAAASC